GFSNLMLLTRLIRPSFADYAEWEKAHLAAASDVVLSATGGLTPDRATGGLSPDEVGTPPSASSEAAPPPAGSPDHRLEYPHARRFRGRLCRPRLDPPGRPLRRKAPPDDALWALPRRGHPPGPPRPPPGRVWAFGDVQGPDPHPLARELRESRRFLPMEEPA